MLVIALIGMPLVLLYTAGVYYFFRGKTGRRAARVLAADRSAERP